MHRKMISCLLSVLMVCSLLAGMAAFCPFTASAAASGPDSAETVWDMESLPDDLYASNYVFDVTSGSGGHTLGYTDASPAAGKGYNGSAAMALTFTADCPTSSFGSDGFYLRLDQDKTANCDWLGISELWFWLDASAFENSALVLELAIDGMHPQLDQPCWLVQNGTTSEQVTFASYDGAKFGSIQLPKGFTGWVGISAGAFATTYGKVKNISINCAPISDAASFPLSLYIDELRIVRQDTTGNALLGGGDLFNQGVDAGDTLLYTDMTNTHQTMVAYGASGCWWSNTYGECSFVDNLLKLLYTDDGIGLNNYRHNIGGGVKEDQSDTNFAGTGRAVYSPLTEDGKYDEDRDIGGYTVLMKLVKLGTVDDFTLFMNSPPSTMTISGTTNGDPWADSASNLRPDCYEAYADYVVDMVQLYNYLGVPIKYVSPINEPQWSWTSGTQEGCHYTAEEAMKLWTLVVQKLNERAETDTTLKGIKLSLSESGSWSDKSFTNYVYYQIMNDETLSAAIDHISCHSYGTSAEDKQRLAKEMWSIGGDVQFHQSEYAPGVEQADFSIATGMDVARVMYEDISILDADTWSYWLAAANGSYTDGLAYFNPNSSDLITTKRLWAMGNYAKFTKGAIRVETDSYGLPDDLLTTAYYNPTEDTVVYVVLNNGKSDQVFGFAGLPSGAVADVYETSAYRDLELRGTMSADSGYNLPAQSVTTFVFHGVEPEDIESGSNPNNPGGHAAVKDFDYTVFHPSAQSSTPEAAGESKSSEPSAKKERTLLPWILGGAALVVLCAIVLILVLRRKKRAVPKQAEADKAPAEDKPETAAEEDGRGERTE